MTITVGNDAEFILYKGSSPISAIGLVGGSKTFPSECLGGALQEDNVLAEININPARNHLQWERNITSVISELVKRLPPDVQVSKYASALYPARQLMSPSANEFGCDPDLNAWTGKENKFVKLRGALTALRSAGGHIHIGIPNLDEASKFELIRSLDAFAGLQAVILDSDTRRKLLYGKAGAMRLKEYGVEWRTPSNFWIHSKASRKWAFQIAKFVGEHRKNVTKLYDGINVPKIINSNNAAHAKKALKELYSSIQFPLHEDINLE